ncbi:hypothetical protein P152DRAFT_387156 [Eremomyces bilateralis CBS 781.70]|uniref:ER-bound oxygenase mpaB/mpaB'/Rubber oxygenase catalytic domain-containing protein n=1 Tax=Eremomyces bilateralis CBS 781.70 TaxID=1392243 RepID=A0A6G1GGY9_9PEZI|nr:uncharacterized protein P152DRAFT_387156 [Eremomyces bilateralis CBS 781.70]KAF1817338.1 hypothetical protein P152DRAFT_387156 [Eremomyces bilateralis CBS 781.70]
MKWGGLDPAYQPKEIKKIVREAILLSGGGVAVLLQMAHPSVAAGVNNHSNFAYRPVDRLRTTMTYVYCMTFGTPAEKEAIINLVHKAHTVVKGKDGGRDYSADDPDLQLWVAATLYATAINLYTKIFGSLPEKEHDKIYTQYAILATSLRVPQKLWPANRAAFWRYWDEQIAKAEINDHARAVAQDVLWNKVAPLWVRAPLPLLRVFTTYMLPPTLREEFGFKDTKSRRAFYNLMVGTLKVTYPLTPKFIRTYPKKYYMNDMRKRLTKMGHVI